MMTAIERLKGLMEKIPDRFLSCSIILSKFSSLCANIWKSSCFSSAPGNGGISSKLTIPSDFLQTFRVMPKEPFPIASSDSYGSRNEEVNISEVQKVMLYKVLNQN